MHDDRVQVERRIDRVLAERLRPAIYGETASLLLGSWQAPGEPVPVQEGLSAQYSETKTGEAWGPPWGTTWFRLTGTVPER
jgi:alpha-mannosidase